MAALAASIENNAGTFRIGPAGYPPSKIPISPEELSRRVGVLKRFRELLQTQRDRFQNYLEVLDKQKEVIPEGTAEELTVHIELEEQLVADIMSIQKVIDPLEAMYRASKSSPIEDLQGPGAKQGEEAEVTAEVSGLKAALMELQKNAVSRTEQNKELLSQRMNQVRSELKNLRFNTLASKNTLSIYGRNDEPSFIDIQG